MELNHKNLIDLLILDNLYYKDQNKIKISKNKNKYDIKINNRFLFKVTGAALYKWIQLNNNIMFMYTIRRFKNIIDLESYLKKNIEQIYNY